jgi:hypothetical protein
MFYTRRLSCCILALALALSLTAACGGGGGGKKPEPTPEPTQPAATSGPEAALAQYVQTTLQKQFVPDCSKADVNTDKDKVCAAFQGERDNLRAYKLGTTFAEFNQWVIMENRNGQWAVQGTLVLNADTAAVPGIPWPLRTGVELVVAGSNPCVNVREGPGLNQKAVDCIKDGTKVRLTAGPTAADGINWWQVEGRTGWVAGDYLRYPDAAQ